MGCAQAGSPWPTTCSDDSGGKGEERHIARLGVAFLTYMQTTGKAQAFSVTGFSSVKPVRYMPTGAVLLFPPQFQITRLLEAEKVYINGWEKSVTLRSTYATPLLLRLCG